MPTRVSIWGFGKGASLYIDSIRVLYSELFRMLKNSFTHIADVGVV